MQHDISKCFKGNTNRKNIVIYKKFQGKFDWLKLTKFQLHTVSNNCFAIE
jgi:hypothetical protein